MADSTFLDNIVAAWGGSEVDIPDRDKDPFPDETRSPNVNTLIRCARKYLAGLVRHADFLDEIQRAVDRLKKALEEHRNFAAQFDLTNEISELARRAETAYVDFSRGLSDMVDSFPREDLTLIDRGIERCKQNAGILEECNERFLELQKAEMRLLCPVCGQSNEPHYRQCVKCNAVLSSDQEEEDSGDMVMVPEDYMYLYEACDRVAAEEISIAEWQGHIDKFVQGFNQTREFVNEQFRLHSEQLGSVEGLEEEADGLLQALESAEEALATMQLFADDGDPDNLNQGWFDLLKATQSIQREGMAFYRTLESIEENEEIGGHAGETHEGAGDEGGDPSESQEHEFAAGRSGDQFSFEEED